MKNKNKIDLKPKSFWNFKIIPNYKNSLNMKFLNSQGQIVVEYVLLLLVATAIAVIVMTTLVKRDSSEPENSGALIKKWRTLQDGVAKDMQD